MNFSLETLIQIFVVFTTEMIVASFLLLDKKMRFRFKAYISIPVGLLIAYGSTALPIIGVYCFPEVFPWNIAVNILAYTIPFVGVYCAFLFAYKKSPSSLAVILSMAYTFQSVTYQTKSLIMDTGLNTLLWQNDMFAFYSTLSEIVEFVVRIAVYVIFYFVFAKPFIKHSKFILKPYVVIFLGLTVYFLTNVVNAYVVQKVWWDQNLRLIMCIALILFCLLFDFHVVGSYKTIENAQENTIMKATLNSKVRQKEMTEQNISFINMKCHDLRKELRRLKNKKDCLENEDFSLLEESLDFFGKSVDTGNVNINALVQDKLIYCNSAGIEFTSLIDGEAFNGIASSDVYFLLCNIIDNAIEATEQIEKPEKRVIDLTASKKQGVLIIEQSNYFKGDLKFNSDGSIKTTKENPKYHGYGTKSIAYIVRKYDGKVDFEIQGDIFKLKIVI